jgi:hypothetical protein
MARYLTEAQFQERISAFESFLQSHQLVFLRIPRERNNVRPYIVSDKEEIAKISFSPLGSIFLLAEDGRLKALLVRWIRQVRGQASHPFSDNTTPERVRELRSVYRDLLDSSISQNNEQETVSPSLAVHIPLIPQDSPLVELAGLLGYTVYLIIPPSVQESPGPRYRVVFDQDVAWEGTNLAEVLAYLIKHLSR